MPANEVLLKVKNLKKYFPVREGLLKREVAQVKAVDDVSFSIREGETLGLVGESGCGKTTAGRTILRLLDATAGSVHFFSRKQADPGRVYKEIDLCRVAPNTLKELRREMQIIFQDPGSSLNPRMTVAALVGEPLKVHKLANPRERKELVRELLALVGLKPDHMKRYPHEFSGGQRQRIGIARALSLSPSLIVADEPVSALDVSIQAQVINLLEDLQQELGLTYLFISHDLSVVRYISTSVAVMYLGRIVETAKTDVLFNAPQHPYTQALISAVLTQEPDDDRKQIILEGDVPSPINPPVGCHFHPRCSYAMAECRIESPVFRNVGHRTLGGLPFGMKSTIDSRRIAGGCLTSTLINRIL